MEGRKSKGYAWAILAGLNAALAAIAAKFFSCQATVTNFATNFLSSGLAGFFLFEEPLSFQWFAGAMFIVVGVFILSKSSIEKESID